MSILAICGLAKTACGKAAATLISVQNADNKSGQKKFITKRAAVQQELNVPFFIIFGCRKPSELCR
jgi:hypothetical protein